ncbi:STY4851/ECs_5259 family protein [Ralstonia pseudosolanacearum]
MMSETIRNSTHYKTRGEGMSQGRTTTSPVRAWLVEFLFVREIFGNPTGLPLFRYQVGSGEYRELEEVLRCHRAHAFHPTYGLSWAAGFCLFVAESFRREYDARDGGWSWGRFENKLSCSFTPQQHGELVRQGLSQYWKRPIRQYHGGRDNLLGSLFIEGGLPWPLVQSDSHGFGKVVRRGLKYFYRTENGHRTTTDLLADFEQDLPQTFRTLETRQLLAGIVEQLMSLATRYPLKGKTDPVLILDQQNPGWRKDFPLPLDEDNARRLISEWLRDAKQHHVAREAQRAGTGVFGCNHRLLELSDGWCIRSEVAIPREAQLPIDTHPLNTTRFELAIFEADRLLATAGTAYGQREDGESGLRVRFLRNQVSLNRRQLGDELTLQMLANGSVAHVVRFEGAALDVRELPLVFECRGDEWWFVASASCSTASERVRVRIPKRFSYTGSGPVNVCHETDDALWLETSDELRLLSEVGDQYTVTARCPEGRRGVFHLKGHLTSYESTPQMVYAGWPRLAPLSDEELPSSIQQYANRRLVISANVAQHLGGIRYIAKNAIGDVLLQRRFGVVPSGFAIHAFPASSSKAARLVVKNARRLQLQVVDSAIRSSVEVGDQDTSISLEPLGDDPPSYLTLEVCGNSGVDSIRFRLPFPYHGARLIGPDGKTTSRRDFTLAELLGLRVALSTSATNGAEFCLQLELNGRDGRCTRHYFIKAGNTPVLLSLFSYQADMLQMLGAVNDQDAFLRVAVETDKPLLNFRVRRYNGALRWEDQSVFAITGPSGTSSVTGASVDAMLLADPKQAPRRISEITSEGVGTGRFRMPASMLSDGPWLIYPATESSTQFRPALHAPDVAASIPDQIRSLHTAARVFHPVSQPDVINEQIVEMASDLDHSGWQYLADLKQHFRHLPLSVFEAWLALSRNQNALAIAVFRLELDEPFCQRIQDELAVIWECVPLPGWASAYAHFREWLVRQGVPAVLLESVLRNRQAMLPAVVSGFREVGNYLETGNANNLRRLPVETILPGWYQQLRRTHEANNRWPTDLGFLLKEWTRRQALPKVVTNLSAVDFSDAVTFLPIFMAFVTAGLTTVDELKANRSPSYVRFAIKMVSDFDKDGWYTPVHSMLVSYLLAEAKT